MVSKTDRRGTAELFSPRELDRFQALRIQYHQGQDCFTEKELAHLQFFRWLYRAGCLAP